MCETSEVLDEDSNYADSAKESSYFGEVFAQAPVDDFVDPRRVGDAAIQGANVPTTVISRAHNNDFLLENVPPQYFICWTMWLRF